MRRFQREPRAASALTSVHLEHDCSTSWATKLYPNKAKAASYELAIVYLGLGDKERSLAFLKKAVEEQAVSAFDPVNKDPIFDRLHSDTCSAASDCRPKLPQERHAFAQSFRGPTGCRIQGT